MLKRQFGVLLAVFFCCYQSFAETSTLKANLERAVVGKPVVSKILLGGKARPKGRLATYPINTIFYPDTNQVIYRTGGTLNPTNIEPAEMKQQFNPGSSFRIAKIDLKDDRLELKLETTNGDSAKLELMLGAGWQLKIDVAFVQEQLAQVLVPDVRPERRQKETNDNPPPPQQQHQSEIAAAPSVSQAPPTVLQHTQQGVSVHGPDAAALEAQYKTCAKHYIPAEKCTPDIYQQLKERDEAPLDPLTTSALNAVKDYQTRLKNPASLQVRTAYITNKGDICLEVGAQNGAGGMTVSNVVYTSKGRWLDEGGLGGAMAQQGGGGVNRWQEACTKGILHPKLVAGTDVTEKVNQALSDAK
jgi:hypothetical protein